VDLAERVAERRFREDLLYRLQVLPIRLPSLAERAGDVPRLVDFFCSRAAQSHGFPRLSVSPSALHAAALAEWPGNIRQLAHAVEAAAIRAVGAGSSSVTREHLFPTDGRATGDTRGPLTYQQATRDFQEHLLRDTLSATGWNVTQTAERLDVARSHVYKLMRSFGLDKRPE
jgi:Nif-specific regulatory protein